MAGLLDLEVLLAGASGVALGLLGAGLLLVRPHRSYTVAFGAFLAVWSGQIVFANLAGLRLLDGDVAGARDGILLHLAFLVCSYVPLVYFAAVYPPGRGRIATSWLGAVGLLVPAVAGAILLPLQPQLFHEGFVGEGSRTRSNWGPLDLVFYGLFLASFYFVAFSIYGRYRRSRDRVGQRQSLLVLLAFAVYLAFWTADSIVVFGSDLVQSGPAAAEPQSIAFLAFASVGTLVLAGALVGILRRGSAAAPRPLVLSAFLVPAAFGLVSGLSAVSPSVPPLITLGLWRLGSAALIAYAILRYDLFDIDVKVKRATIVAGVFALAAALGLGLQWSIEALTGSAGVATTATEVVVLGAAAVLVVRSPTASRWLAARIAPGVGSTDRLEGRRLEVYEAALARAAAERRLDVDDAELVGLRSRLGVSTAEHDLLARLVRSGGLLPPHTAAVLVPGATVGGRYRLERQIGQGAFARAFLAKDATLQRSVVVKALHARRAESEDDVRDFLREARTAAALEHPNIVRVYDFGYAGDVPYIVMEHAEAGSLAGRLGKERPMPATEAARIMDDVLAGLAYVHDRGLLHRDLKPANILLAPDGTAKLGDFGLAVPLAAQAARAEGADPFRGGTPAYMSPEAVRGERLTPASDLYSAGALVYQMATGTTYVPFEGRTADEVRRAIHEEPPRPPGPAVDARVRSALSRALHKDPRRRFQQAEQMRRALGRKSPPVISPGTAAATGRRR